MLLDAIKDRTKWIEILGELPIELRDIYFNPDYVRLNCTHNDSQAYLFVYKKKEKIWINPFIKIKTPIYVKNIKKIFYDLETPYGYGGPISNSNDREFINNGNEKFLEWVKDSNILAEFIRFHPLFNTNQYAHTSVKIIEDRTTCSLNLELVNEKFEPFKSKVKNMIRIAKRNKLSVKISKSKEDFDFFKKIYINLMFKKKAEKNLFFEENYFENLFNLIVSCGITVIVKHQDQNIAAGIFLYGEKFLHYHLSASDLHLRKNGTFNLMIYEAAMYGKKIGLKTLHLGGGNLKKHNDSLFKFKSSMSTHQHIFMIGKRINNLKIYNNNVKQWKIKYPLLSKTYRNRLLCYHLNASILSTNNL
jgi:hypothetical protein|tara:strand:- start:6619 stop:7701 length:1083 start_codon:yes stop_codon:yes gene_type:complete